MLSFQVSYAHQFYCVFLCVEPNQMRGINERYCTICTLVYIRTILNIYTKGASQVAMCAEQTIVWTGTLFILYLLAFPWPSIKLPLWLLDLHPYCTYMCLISSVRYFLYYNLACSYISKRLLKNIYVLRLNFNLNYFIRVMCHCNQLLKFIRTTFSFRQCPTSDGRLL